MIYGCSYYGICVTYHSAVITITASSRAAPNTEPMTIAAISPPERPSDCESALVTVGVMIDVRIGIVELVVVVKVVGEITN